MPKFFILIIMDVDFLKLESKILWHNDKKHFLINAYMDRCDCFCCSTCDLHIICKLKLWKFDSHVECTHI